MHCEIFSTRIGMYTSTPANVDGCLAGTVWLVHAKFSNPKIIFSNVKLSKHPNPKRIFPNLVFLEGRNSITRFSNHIHLKHTNPRTIFLTLMSLECPILETLFSNFIPLERPDPNPYSQASFPENAKPPQLFLKLRFPTTNQLQNDHLIPHST